MLCNIWKNKICLTRLCGTSIYILAHFAVASFFVFCVWGGGGGKGGGLAIHTNMSDMPAYRF